MTGVGDLVERNPPWAPKLSQHLIARLYVADAKGILDEELLDEVGYGLLARCESMIVVTDASRGLVRCPRCGEVLTHDNNPGDLLRCEKCEWRKRWRAYKKAYKGQLLFCGGIELFVREYFEQFPRARSARQRMLLIDRLLHRWHWEYENQPGRASGSNFIEGPQEDVVAFLNGLTYSENSTPGLSANLQAWKEKPREAIEASLGGVDTESVRDALKSPDPRQRLEAFEILRDLQVERKLYVDFMKAGLADTNRKVRGIAAGALARVAAEDAEEATKLVTLLIPLLQDGSNSVRARVACDLRGLARYVPLEAAARALLNEEHPPNRRGMELLLRDVLDAKSEVW